MCYPWIVSNFEIIPSDNADVRLNGGRRYEQVWIQKYLPKNAKVLHVNGQLQTIYNVQNVLTAPDSHVVLNANTDVIDQLTNMKTSNSFRVSIIHGALADQNEPVAVTARSYAITDYDGKTREEIEKYGNFTIAQLASLHGVKFNAFISEYQMELVSELETIIKQFVDGDMPIDVMLVRIRNTDKKQISDMLFKYHLEIQQSFIDSILIKAIQVKDRT